MNYLEVNNLPPDEIDAAVMTAVNYYRDLDSKGCKYAKLPLEVVRNEGEYGKLANIHLEKQAEFDGLSKADIPALKDKIIIRLACRDAEMRRYRGNQGRDAELKEIEQYHIEEFSQYISPYACGGLIMRELQGSGSWMDAYEKGQGFFVNGLDVLLASSNDSKFSKHRMFQASSHSVRTYISNIDSTFRPEIEAASKEDAATKFGVDIDRVREIPQNKSILGIDDPRFNSKLFQILPAKAVQ